MQTKWTTLSVLTMLVFVALVPVVASLGTGPGFWMWLPEAVTPAGHDIGTLFNWVLFLTVILFVDIHVIMVYFVLRYPEPSEEERELLSLAGGNMAWSVVPSVLLTVVGYYLFAPVQPGIGTGVVALLFLVAHTIGLGLILREGDHEPSRTAKTHGHLGIEITWTIIPTIIMVVLGIYTFNVYSRVTTAPSDPLDVEVVGRQFQWTFDYKPIELEGQDLTNRLILPADRPIQLHMNSPDVLHSFFVPSFRTKQDLVPGRETKLNIRRISRTGHYEIKCAELCGVGHYRMLGDLLVVKPALFDRLMALSPRQFKLWRNLDLNQLQSVWMKLSGGEFDRWVRRWQQLQQKTPDGELQYERQLDLWSDLSPEHLRAWTELSPGEFEDWKSISGEDASRQYLEKVSANE